jgi:hypothetical protein
MLSRSVFSPPRAPRPARRSPFHGGNSHSAAHGCLAQCSEVSLGSRYVLQVKLVAADQT